MSQKFLYLTLLILLLISFFLAQKWLNKTTKIDSSSSEKCGMENCHGLNITCGPKIPEICTMVYEPGDNCRQYASCQIINKKCQLVKSQKFEECKSCTEECKKNFENDPLRFSECESKCSE